MSPKMPPRPCTQPGCKEYAAKDGRCDAHKRQAWESNMGKSRHKRGYGSSWNKIRKRILSRDGYLCQTCKRQGIVTYAKIVDHIINKASGGTNADDNLEVICDNCHKEKTQREAQKGKNDGRY